MLLAKDAKARRSGVIDDVWVVEFRKTVAPSNVIFDQPIRP